MWLPNNPGIRFFPYKNMFIFICQNHLVARGFIDCGWIFFPGWARAHITAGEGTHIFFEKYFNAHEGFQDPSLQKIHPRLVIPCVNTLLRYCSYWWYIVRGVQHLSTNQECCIPCNVKRTTLHAVHFFLLQLLTVHYPRRRMFEARKFIPCPRRGVI